MVEASAIGTEGATPAERSNQFAEGSGVHICSSDVAFGVFHAVVSVRDAREDRLAVDSGSLRLTSRLYARFGGVRLGLYRPPPSAAGPQAECRASRSRMRAPVRTTALE